MQRFPRRSPLGGAPRARQQRRHHGAREEKASSPLNSPPPPSVREAPRAFSATAQCAPRVQGAARAGSVPRARTRQRLTAASEESVLVHPQEKCQSASRHPIARSLLRRAPRRRYDPRLERLAVHLRKAQLARAHRESRLPALGRTHASPPRVSLPSVGGEARGAAPQEAPPRAQSRELTGSREWGGMGGVGGASAGSRSAVPLVTTPFPHPTPGVGAPARVPALPVAWLRSAEAGGAIKEDHTQELGVQLPAHRAHWGRS